MLGRHSNNGATKPNPRQNLEIIESLREMYFGTVASLAIVHFHPWGMCSVLHSTLFIQSELFLQRSQVPEETRSPDGGLHVVTATRQDLFLPCFNQDILGTECTVLLDNA